MAQASDGGRFGIEAQLHAFQRKKAVQKASAGKLMDFRSPTHKLFFDILHHSWFDSCFGMIIMLNLVLVVIETDTSASKDEVPGWVDGMGWVILLAFVVELGIRLFVLQLDFFFDGANLFDFILVVVDLVFNLLGLLGGKLFPVSFLRIVRLVKLARVTKAFRIFPELRLMMAGLMGSLKAIFWGTVLLTFALIVSAILFVQFIHPLNVELAATGIYGTTCERCSRAYSSVFQASLTFIQQIVAGDAWGTVSVQVIENYPLTGILYAFTFMSIGMAVLNLILGVVVDVASQAREKMRTELDDEKLIERMEVHSHLLDVCKDMDKDGNGEITHSELHNGYKENATFRSALDFMNITSEDLEILWTILDNDKSGTVSYGEFVTSCYKLKSSSTHFMLAYIKYYITVIKDQICTEIEGVKETVIEEEKKMEAEMTILEAEEQRVEQGVEQAHAELEIIEVGLGNACQDKASESYQEESSKSPEAAKEGVGSSVQDSIDQLTGVVGTLLRSIEDSNKAMGAASDTCEDGFKEDKEGKLLVNPDLPENKYAGNRLLGPQRGLPEQESHILLNLLQTTEKQQLQLLASMEEIRQKIGLSTGLGTPSRITSSRVKMASQFANEVPLLVIPPERHAALFLPSCGNSCVGAPKVEVLSLP